MSEPKGQTPLHHYTSRYFEQWNYADRGRGTLSMYRFARRYYAALVRRYAPPGRGRMLELGCGLGHLLALLQEDFDCVGIDLMDYSVEQTRRNAPGAEVHVMSADDLAAFGDGEFGTAVALHLLEHLADPVRTLHEVQRVLEPGGLWMFATPNPDYAFRRFKDHATDAIGKDETHINVHPPERWRDWCESSGFTVVRHYGDGLWDVPYVPKVPSSIQFGLFGLPALVQVLTRTTITPLAYGVNQICIARKPR
jgi:SAM-dependent methyltransferase